jgi:hypothetical protein
MRPDFGMILESCGTPHEGRLLLSLSGEFADKQKSPAEAGLFRLISA